MNSNTAVVNHAVVLAGGLGTRLATVSKGVPKALVRVDGRPFLDYKFRELEKNSITSVTLLTHHGKEAIEAHLESRPFDLIIKCVDDGPVGLGTGGALAAAARDLPNNFFLTYGDNLLFLDYQSMATSAYWMDGQSVLAVTNEAGPADRLNSKYVEGMVTDHDKRTEKSMNCLDYGLILLHKEHVDRFVALHHHAPYGFDLILKYLAEQGLLAGYPTNEPYFEIGTPETLALTSRWLESQSRGCP